MNITKVLHYDISNLENLSLLEEVYTTITGTNNDNSSKLERNVIVERYIGTILTAMLCAKGHSVVTVTEERGAVYPLIMSAMSIIATHMQRYLNLKYTYTLVPIITGTNLDVTLVGSRLYQCW